MLDNFRNWLIIKHFHPIHWILGWTISILLLVSTSFRVEAVTNLAFFQGVGEDEQIRLIWETTLESDTAGFYILRSEQRDSGFQKVNTSLISAQGSDSSGEFYEYIDTGLVNGREYWYRLEAVDSSGGSQLFDPIRVIVGVANSPTITVTITNILGATLTPTLPVLATPTGTIQFETTPTNQSISPYPIEETPIPQLPFDPVSLIETPTLIPFPTITVLFPDLSVPGIPGYQKPARGLAILRGTDLFDIWPFGAIIFLWIILGIGIVLSRRYFE